MTSKLPNVESCREWIESPRFDRCGEKAVGIIWGKLFPPEALGPRCADHVALHCNGRGMNELMAAAYAIYDLRPVNALHE